MSRGRGTATPAEANGPVSPGKAPAARRQGWLHPRLAGALLLALYAVMATGYNAVTPLFEAPDENAHFFFVQHLARGGGLPVQPTEPDARGPWEQEGSQPPLYYAIMAPIARIVGAPLDPDNLRYNDQNSMGSPAIQGNDNRFVHTAAEAWPWHGWAATVHAVRAASTLLGALTVAGVMAIALVVFPSRPWLAVASGAVVALDPAFLSTTASVTNDALITALSTLGLYLLLRVAQRPEDGRRVVLLWLVVGCAPLVKLSGLALAGFALAALAGVAVRRRDPGWFVRSAGGLVLAVALLSGWWYARNLHLYGDLTGLARMLPGRTRRDFVLVPWLAGLPAELLGLWRSAWGLFGWFTVLMPEWVYRLIDVAVVGALIGLARGGIQRGDGRALARWPVVAWLAAWGAVVFASLLRWLTLAKGAHGRLLFPAVAGGGVLLVAGWRGLLPRRVGDPALAGTVVTAFGALAAYALFGVVRPAYALPPIYIGEDPPPGARATGAVFGEGLELAWIRVPERVTAGTAAPVDLYWGARRRLTRGGYVALRVDQPAPDPPDAHAASPVMTLRPFSGTVSGPAQLSFLGGGALPPDLMEPAKIYVDHRSVAFPEVASPPVVVAGVVGRTPVAVRLSVHVYDPEAGHRWSGTGVDAAQEWSTTSVLVPRDALTLPEAVAEAGPVARFGNGVSAYLPQGPPAAGEPLTVLWTVDEPVETDLSAFVHVIVDGEMRGAFDRAPATSAPLPTSYWRPGDVVPGWFPVEVPAGAGNIAIRLGLYATDGDRVPAFRPDGSQWPDDAVVVPVRP